MEESIAGFKERGDWADIVEHGERITRALRDIGVESDAFDEWNEWRPKVHEHIEKDVSEKTAEKASVGEGKGEQRGKTVTEDLQESGDKIAESYERLEEQDTRGAVEKWQDSIDYVARAADSAGRKALRKVEGTVYRKVMTQIAPYYFDNPLISANLQRSTRGGEETFIFEININDDELKEQVSDRLGEYEADHDRWHVDTEKETDHVEAAEGVETPKSETRSKPTSN